MRVTINSDRCQGHGRCALIAPAVFDTGDLGMAQVLVDIVPEVHRSDVEEARLCCPEDAIAISS